METAEDQITTIPELDSVLLSATDLKDLERLYQNVHGDDMQEVSMPEMTLKPEFQRYLGPVKLVQHGNATKRFVSMIKAMRNVNELTVKKWEQICDNEGLAYLKEASGGGSRSSSEGTSMDSSYNVRVEQPEPKDARSQKKSTKAFNAQRRHSFSSSADQSDTAGCSNRGNGDDLEDFVVPDVEPDYEERRDSTPFSSLPPDFPMPKRKPFFEPTHFTATQDTNDDEDAMPDLTDLLGRRNVQSSQEKLKCERGRRGRRKQILEEDEDSDE